MLMVTAQVAKATDPALRLPAGQDLGEIRTLYDVAGEAVDVLDAPCRRALGIMKFVQRSQSAAGQVFIELGAGRSLHRPNGVSSSCDVASRIAATFACIALGMSIAVL